MHTGIWWGNLKERDHLENPVIDGRIIFRWIYRKWDGDWTDLDKDREGWQAFVNMVINLLVPQNMGNFLTS